MPYHDRAERFAVGVAHRRCGKTVACINDTIRRAITEGKTDARYAYVAPQYNQAKDVAWLYLKKYAEPITQQSNESELYVRLINGATIRLYGADNPDRLRGIYLDGAVLDEYADMHPNVWGEVIRPLLTDRRGWATFIGTPKGHNSFYDIYNRAKVSPDWHTFVLRASETGIVPAQELQDARADMSDDQYAQEFECSFEAAIQGAIYGKLIEDADKAGRLCRVDYDRSTPVKTSWDIGFDDSTVIWFWQIVGNEVRIIDYYEANGHGVEHYCDVVKSKSYKYGRHYVPHDAAHKLMAAGGRSIVEQAKDHGVMMFVVNATTQANSIEALRVTLPHSWIDSDKCATGIEALRMYRYAFDAKRNVFSTKPLHDWSSHACDALEIMARVWREEKQPEKPQPPKFLHNCTANDIFWPSQQNQPRRDRL